MRLLSRSSSGSALLISIFLCLHLNAAAVDIGVAGSVQTGFTLGIDDTYAPEWSSNHTTQAEVLFPPWDYTEIGLAFAASYNHQQGLHIFPEQISIQHSWKRLQLKLGRFPVEWSYDTLATPSEFSHIHLVADYIMEQPTHDALELSMQIPGNLTFTTIGAMPQHSNSPLLGTRLSFVSSLMHVQLAFIRDNGPDTADHLNDPPADTPPEVSFFEQRNKVFTAIYTSFMPIEVYGSVGTHFTEIESRDDFSLVAHAGARGKFPINSKSELLIQGDYLFTELLITRELLATDHNLIERANRSENTHTGLIDIQLVLGEFHNVSVAAMFDAFEPSAVVQPMYSGYFGELVEYKIKGKLYLGSMDSRFGPSSSAADSRPKLGSLSVELSVPF